MGRTSVVAVLFAIVMVIFSVMRLALYFSYPDIFDSLTPSQTLLAFVNGWRFDAAIIARLWVIPLVLLLLPLAWFDRRWWVNFWVWLLFIVSVALILLLVVDVIYFAEVKRHMSYELMKMGNDIGFVFDLLDAMWLELLLFLGGVWAFGFLWRASLPITIRAERFRLVTFVVVLLAVVVAGRGGLEGKALEIIDAYGSGNSSYGHLSLNGAFTSIVSGRQYDGTNHHFFPQEKAIQILKQHREVISAELPMLQRISGSSTGHNLVFLVLESWSSKHIDSFSDNNYGATPHFDALAKDGLRFTQFYAAGQRSIEGIQASLTGMLPLKGVPKLDVGAGISNFSRLGAMAREHDYSTLFVQSSNRDSFKIQGIASAIGFDHFYGREDIPLIYDYPDPEASTFGWDYDTLQFLKSRIDQASQPFFAFGFTGTTHLPYNLVAEQFRIREHDQKEGGFLNTLAYADWSLGQMMQAARQQPWFDNTIFVITADHANRYSKGDLLDRFHIPLLIYAPKIIKAGSNSVIGSQYDLMPTIMDLLGFDQPFSSLGQSLLKKSRGEALLSIGGVGLALVNEQGHIKHSLKNRLESKGRNGNTLDEQTLAEMENYLLAMDQLSFELLQENRWAPQ